MSSSLRLLALSFLPLTTLSLAQPPPGWNSDQCECFLVDGAASPSFYAEHAFFDFRDLSDFAGTPAPLTGETQSAKADFTSKYFEGKAWNKFWQIRNGSSSSDDDGPVPTINSANNVYIQRNQDEYPAADTYLSLRTNRQPSFQAAADFASVDGFRHCSIRFLGRIRGEPGAVTGMSTSASATANGTADLQETAVEMLTRERADRIHYANGSTSRNMTLPDGLTWDDWIGHRLDWTPTQSIWYANGIQTANVSFPTPRDPSLLIFSTWGDGSTKSGTMSVYGEAYMQIQWLQIVYNTTATNSERTCGMVCSIDQGGVDDRSTTWLWGSDAASRRLSGKRSRLRLVAWPLGIFVLLPWNLQHFSSLSCLGRAGAIVLLSWWLGYVMPLIA